MTTAKEPVAAARMTDFGPLRIAYDERVLEPRAWTQLQGRWAAELAEISPPGPVLELCSGAGQIGLLAVHGSTRRLVAVDSSTAACDFTWANAHAAGIEDRVEVRMGKLESACAPGEMFAVIVADPPWVPRRLTGTFPEDPLSAIDGGEDGLDVARACLKVIEDHLLPGGHALLQLGSTAQVRALRRSMPVSLMMSQMRTEGRRGVVAHLVRVD